MAVQDAFYPKTVQNMFHSFFHPEEGYQNAESELQKYFDMAEQHGKNAQDFLQPYNQGGQDQYARLNSQAAELGDPAALEAKFANSYTESPYARQTQKEATASGLDAASSMGLLGSSAALNNIQKSAGNIMQADRQKFMDDLMQKYMASVGIGQNLYGVGAGAAGAQSGNEVQFGKNALNMGENTAGLKYGETNAPGEMFGKIAGTAADLGINYATGGIKK